MDRPFLMCPAILGIFYPKKFPTHCVAEHKRFLKLTKEDHNIITAFNFKVGLLKRSHFIFIWKMRINNTFNKWQTSSQNYFYALCHQFWLVSIFHLSCVGITTMTLYSRRKWQYPEVVSEYFINQFLTHPPHHSWKILKRYIIMNLTIVGSKSKEGIVFWEAVCPV